MCSDVVKVEGFGCIMHKLCFTTGVSLWSWGTYAESSSEKIAGNV